MTLEQYIDSINKRYKLGNATEHTFRGDLQQLIESLVPEIRATNEPQRQACGAPDYILTKNEIPIGFIEAKDIGDKDLDGKKSSANKEQFDRYKASLNNLIFTDYLDFRLYRDGQFIISLAIGELTDKGIKPLPKNFAAFENLIKDFCIHVGQTIKSPKKLAEMMAGKARLLSDVIEKALTSDETNQEDSTLKDQMNAFRQILIYDITPKGFADVYAQTIAYGMFAARLHDTSLATFTRQEAAELIPKSNPFLRKLFGYIAGPELDDRIKWIVDSLVDIFLATDVADILSNFGKSTKTEDPIIHFYETFLSEYDPKLRKARGVWYTPQPVVNFIVRAVDDILKTEFDLPQGLADNSKTKIKVNLQGKMVEQEVHKVQILDPATGTGTFLAEVVKHIHKKFEGQQGIWSNYVETHLLPRLNGFELLMASYAMAHLKLDLLLKETGYNPTEASYNPTEVSYKPAKASYKATEASYKATEASYKATEASLRGTKQSQRLRVYLTNSLEEHHQYTGTLFASWLSTEANEANYIKRDTPVMVVMGNPPYSVSSSNKSEWIEKLTADYKKDLNEKNIQPLSDDYIKFIRFGQHFIDKNGTGVLAYISNNSFIDGIIHRQMRKHLLESFDKIYILDLHGNAMKKETALGGEKDENVFDIQQGVSINIFVKTGKKKKNELGKVLHFDLQAGREFKYDFLNDNDLKSLEWNKLKPGESNFFFVKKDFGGEFEYKEGFLLGELFLSYSTGVETGNDERFIQFNSNDFIDYVDSKKIVKIAYRPFDSRFCYYDNDVLRRAAYKNLKNLLHENYGIAFPRQSTNFEWSHIQIVKGLFDNRAHYSNKGRSLICPLYLYPETTTQQTIDQTPERTPNLNQSIVKQISDKLALTFTNEKETTENTFAPIDLLDYIYAVLHSPTYREKYKEFLKIDFPRVPYPKDVETFWQLVKLGGEIRQIHLLESPVVEKYMTQYNIDGDNVVGKIKYQNGNVYINETQYFANVPEAAWNFYIGGYQPAQKWLKDRKERKLEFDDILHYQKIIVALTETNRLMKEIEKIDIE